VRLGKRLQIAIIHSLNKEKRLMNENDEVVSRFAGEKSSLKESLKTFSD
jgi:hypothetical protein